MRVPVEVMRRLMALEQAAIEATRRRNDAVALVLATLGAPTGAQIVLMPDGSGGIDVPPLPVEPDGSPPIDPLLPPE